LFPPYYRDCWHEVSRNYLLKTSLYSWK